MAQDKPLSSIESANEAYKNRAFQLDQGDELVREEQAKAEEGFEHPESPLVEEQRFVANPDELRKDVDSEEKFLPFEGAGDDVEKTDVEESAEEPAKPAPKSETEKG